MDKKAEAYAKYNNAAIAEMMVRIIPEVAREIAAPISQIDKINIYGGGSNGEGGAAQISGITPTVLHQVFDTMSEATGVDVREILKANTYDAKVNKNVNIKGAEDIISVASGKGAESEKSDEPAEKVKTAKKDE